MSRSETPAGAAQIWAGTTAGATAGGVLLGLGVAALTVDLDPRLAGDAPVLLAWGALLYGFLAAGCGVLAGGLLEAAAWAAQGRGIMRSTPIARTVVFAVATAPVVYFLLLPGVGLGERILTDAIFAGTWALRLVYLGAFGGLCLLAGAVLVALHARLGRRAIAGLWLVSALLLSLFALLAPAGRDTGREQATIQNADGDSSRSPAQAQRSPVKALDPAVAPVLLLTIDGADPRVLGELIEAGELPAFQRMIDKGTYGELATFVPTLSPVIWTTLATGRRPADHGIHHFVHYRIPGVSAPVHEFPLHTGLNFEILPRLEELLDIDLHAPYTTGMRHVEALWNLVDRAGGRVGVYRWLMSWPAEPVDGFFVAGGIAWVDLRGDGRIHPLDLFEGVESGPLPAPSNAGLRRVFGVVPGKGRPGRKQLVAALRDPTTRDLAHLIERHRPHFAAASFYPVDGAQHLFGRHRGGEHPAAPAVDAHYRLTDRRLGQLLDELDRIGPSTRVIVVSDHGYDFRANHHTHAPPGIFLARGRGFAAGARIEGLSVYDVAPLVLRLLGLPVAENMPGAQSHSRALDPQWAQANPGELIATWERADRREAKREELDDDEQKELEEALRSLGYVE